MPLRLPNEGQTLLAELTGGQTSESSTYSLLISVLDHLGARITSVVLNPESSGALESCLCLDVPGGNRQVPAHPIAALTAGLRQGCRIFLNADSFEKIGFPGQKAGGQDNCASGAESCKVNDDGHNDGLPPAVRDFLSTLDLSGLASGGEETGR